jgi:hypothetical protein
MPVLQWIANNSFELVQTFLGSGIIFFAYKLGRDTDSRRVTNLIAINDGRREAWNPYYEYPELRRVRSSSVNISEKAISDTEELFVINLILHLNVAFQAKKHGELITLEGLQQDVANFFSLPIPRKVWEKNKILQNADFVAFVESALGPVARGN